MNYKSFWISVKEKFANFLLCLYTVDKKNLSHNLKLQCLSLFLSALYVMHILKFFKTPTNFVYFIMWFSLEMEKSFWKSQVQGFGKKNLKEKGERIKHLETNHLEIFELWRTCSDECTWQAMRNYMFLHNHKLGLFELSEYIII